ncbi:hypothetical protein Pcinc_012047 [Petrolisthes cinctipes]|uniref:Tesmin/TSO1-like CXC domain-containing protein n=1 Tax=Petrolisthes cinctipes TaxID=88211 RepID=A0AAE1G2G9_PETCI|nr:hypothetical protein Pcinc_012047 [Petrolisthes cinctipes]
MQSTQEASVNENCVVGVSSVTSVYTELKSDDVISLPMSSAVKGKCLVSDNSTEGVNNLANQTVEGGYITVQNNVLISQTVKDKVCRNGGSARIYRQQRKQNFHTVKTREKEPSDGSSCLIDLTSDQEEEEDHQPPEIKQDNSPDSNGSMSLQCYNQFGPTNLLDTPQYITSHLKCNQGLSDSEPYSKRDKNSSLVNSLNLKSHRRYTCNITSKRHEPYKKDATNIIRSAVSDAGEFNAAFRKGSPLITKPQPEEHTVGQKVFDKKGHQCTPLNLWKDSCHTESVNVDCKNVGKELNTSKTWPAASQFYTNTQNISVASLQQTELQDSTERKKFGEIVKDSCVDFTNILPSPSPSLTVSSCLATSSNSQQSVTTSEHFTQPYEQNMSIIEDGIDSDHNLLRFNGTGFNTMNSVYAVCSPVLSDSLNKVLEPPAEFQINENITTSFDIQNDVQRFVVEGDKLPVLENLDDLPLSSIDERNDTLFEEDWPDFRELVDTPEAELLVPPFPECVYSNQQPPSLQNVVSQNIDTQIQKFSFENTMEQSCNNSYVIGLKNGLTPSSEVVWSVQTPKPSVTPILPQENSVGTFDNPETLLRNLLEDNTCNLPSGFPGTFSSSLDNCSNKVLEKDLRSDDKYMTSFLQECIIGGVKMSCPTKTHKDLQATNNTHITEGDTCTDNSQNGSQVMPILNSVFPAADKSSLNDIDLLNSEISFHQEQTVINQTLVYHKSQDVPMMCGLASSNVDTNIDDLFHTFEQDCTGIVSCDTDVRHNNLNKKLSLETDRYDVSSTVVDKTDEDTTPVSDLDALLDSFFEDKSTSVNCSVSQKITQTDNIIQDSNKAPKSITGNSASSCTAHQAGVSMKKKVVEDKDSDCMVIESQQQRKKSSNPAKILDKGLTDDVVLLPVSHPNNQQNSQSGALSTQYLLTSRGKNSSLPLNVTFKMRPANMVSVPVRSSSQTKTTAGKQSTGTDNHKPKTLRFILDKSQQLQGSGNWPKREEFHPEEYVILQRKTVSNNKYGTGTTIAPKTSTGSFFGPSNNSAQSIVGNETNRLVLPVGQTGLSITIPKSVPTNIRSFVAPIDSNTVIPNMGIIALSSVTKTGVEGKQSLYIRPQVTSHSTTNQTSARNSNANVILSRKMPIPIASTSDSVSKAHKLPISRIPNVELPIRKIAPQITSSVLPSAGLHNTPLHLRNTSTLIPNPMNNSGKGLPTVKYSLKNLVTHGNTRVPPFIYVTGKVPKIPIPASPQLSTEPVKISIHTRASRRLSTKSEANTSDISVTVAASGRQQQQQHNLKSEFVENLKKKLLPKKSQPKFLQNLLQVMQEQLKSHFPELPESVVRCLSLPQRALQRGYLTVWDLRTLHTQALATHLRIILREHVVRCTTHDCAACFTFLQHRDALALAECRAYQNSRGRSDNSEKQGRTKSSKRKRGGSNSNTTANNTSTKRKAYHLEPFSDSQQPAKASKIDSDNTLSGNQLVHLKIAHGDTSGGRRLKRWNSESDLYTLRTTTIPGLDRVLSYDDSYILLYHTIRNSAIVLDWNESQVTTNTNHDIVSPSLDTAHRPVLQSDKSSIKSLCHSGHPSHHSHVVNQTKSIGTGARVMRTDNQPKEAKREGYLLREIHQSAITDLLLRKKVEEDYCLYDEVVGEGERHLDTESPRGKREGLVLAQSDGGKISVRSPISLPSSSPTSQSPLCLTMTDLQVGPLSLAGSRSSCNKATFHVLYSARKFVYRLSGCWAERVRKSSCWCSVDKGVSTSTPPQLFLTLHIPFNTLHAINITNNKLLLLVNTAPVLHVMVGLKGWSGPLARGQASIAPTTPSLSPSQCAHISSIKATMAVHPLHKVMLERGVGLLVRAELQRWCPWFQRALARPFPIPANHTPSWALSSPSSNSVSSSPSPPSSLLSRFPAALSSQSLPQASLPSQSLPPSILPSLSSQSLPPSSIASQSLPPATLPSQSLPPTSHPLQSPLQTTFPVQSSSQSPAGVLVSCSPLSGLETSSLPPSSMLSQSLLVPPSVPSAVVPLLGSPSEMITSSESKFYSQSEPVPRCKPGLEQSLKMTQLSSEIISGGICEAGGNSMWGLSSDVDNKVSFEPKLVPTVVTNCVTMKNSRCEADSEAEFVAQSNASCVMASEDVGKCISGSEGMHETVTSTLNIEMGQEHSSCEDLSRLKCKRNHVVDTENCEMGCEPGCDTVTFPSCGMVQELDSKLIHEPSSDLAFESHRKMVLESDCKPVQKPTSEVAFENNSRLVHQSNTEITFNTNSKLVLPNTVITRNPNSRVFPEVNTESSREPKSGVALHPNHNTFNESRMDLGGKLDAAGISSKEVCEETNKFSKVNNEGKGRLDNKAECKLSSTQLMKAPFLKMNIPAAPSSSASAKLEKSAPPTHPPTEKETRAKRSVKCEGTAVVTELTSAYHRSCAEGEVVEGEATRLPITSSISTTCDAPHFTLSSKTQGLLSAFPFSSALPLPLVPYLKEGCNCSHSCRVMTCPCARGGMVCRLGESQGCQCKACDNPLSLLHLLGLDVHLARMDNCLMQNLYSHTLQSLCSLLASHVVAPCCGATLELVCILPGVGGCRWCGAAMCQQCTPSTSDSRCAYCNTNKFFDV